MKKLAIFLCLALLVSSVASIGLSAVADETESTVVFENDFSTMTSSVPEGMYALKYEKSGATSYGMVAGDNNGPVDGKWDCSITTLPADKKWIYGFAVYKDFVGGGDYTISFDYEIGTVSGTTAFRLFMQSIPDSKTGVGTNLKYYDIIEQRTLANGQKGTCTISVNDEAFINHGTFDPQAAENVNKPVSFYIASKGVSNFTIDNLTITEKVAGNDTPVTKFSSTFPEELDTTGLYALEYNQSGHSSYGLVDGDNNGPVDGKWACSITTLPADKKWIYGLAVYGKDKDFVGGGDYTISFDYEIGTVSGTTAFRLFMQSIPDSQTGVGTNLKYYDIIEQRTLANGQKGTCTISVNDEAFINHNGFDPQAAENVNKPVSFYIAAKGVCDFTIDNLVITETTKVAPPAGGETPPAGDETPEAGVLLDADFTTLPEAVTNFADCANGRYFANVAAADGVLSCTAPTAANAWNSVFTVGKAAPFMVWESAATGNNAYKIAFDWALPTGTTAAADSSAELRMLIYIENTETRIVQPTIVKGVQTAGATGRFEQTIQFNGSENVSANSVDGTSNYKVYLAFLAKHMDNVTIDNLKITDVSPEDIGTETVILDTDFSTATVDGLLALGGGTSRYYGNAEGDINGIVDGAWKSFKANYAEDTASKLQWYSAWGTHTTANPIIWGQNYAYRVEFDWAIPGACTDAQFRLIMEGAHLDNPSLNNNGDPRPYEVGIYNTDGTYSAAGTKITQTEASSGKFAATFAVNNLNLNEDNTPKDGATLRFVVRSQLESFTIDNLKITRVAIAPDVKEEPEKPSEELETKVLVETDFTSMPLGLGNTWGGSYEVVGINDELDVWQADAEQTPAGWKMIFNTVYDICPIVWGEGHSYKVELSYSLPKGTGDTGRFELVLDKDDGTQDNRVTQATVFDAAKSGALEAGDTVYTYEKTFVTSGTPKVGTFVDGDPIMLKFMAKTLPAIYIHSVKITDLNAALCPEIKLPEVDDSEEEVSQPITVTVALVDEDGKPLANQGFKLDAGEILTTDENGRYEFKDVISGAYTINLVDEDGNVISSAYYTILAGEATDIFGNFATIDKTVENLFITMKYADGKLTVEEMTVDVPAVDDEDNTDDSNDNDDDTIIDNGSSDTDAEEETESPETGDTFCVWAFVVLALSGVVALFFSKKHAFSAK